MKTFPTTLSSSSSRPIRPLSSLGSSSSSPFASLPSFRRPLPSRLYATPSSFSTTAPPPLTSISCSKTSTLSPRRRDGQRGTPSPAASSSNHPPPPNLPCPTSSIVLASSLTPASSSSSSRSPPPHVSLALPTSSPAPIASDRPLPPTTESLLPSPSRSPSSSVRSPPSTFPSFLLPFLPKHGSHPSLIDPSSPTPPAPQIAHLPAPAPLPQVQILSKLTALLPYATRRQHELILHYYTQLHDTILTDEVHKLVAVRLSEASGAHVHFQRLWIVIERMVDLGVEIPSRCQQMLLKWAHPQTEATQPFSLIDEDRGGSGVEAVAAWKMMFKEDPEAGKGIDQEKRPAYETLLKKDLEPETFKRLASRSFAASRNLALQISSSVRHQSRSFKPSATATQSSFPSSFRSSQSPVHSHAYSTTTTFLPPRNPNQTQRRSYSSVVVSNLPSILASSSPDVQLDTQAFNSLLYAFASDDNVRLTIPLEAYVALRRHAAGVRWRAPYIEKASLGLYHNYDDATESYANPILDSLSYDLPVGLKPDRQTYSIMLKSCIMRGDLSLALTVFKDMLNPNSNALRMENSPPGPAGAPPVKLDVFPPGLPEYTFFFQGFFEYGEVPGMREDDERVYDTWSKKVVRVGGEDRQEALEVMEEELDAAAEEGKGTRRKGERLSKRELEVRERTTWLWMTGMGFWEGPTGDEADGVQFTGEATMKKQWAVNKATEGKVWALPTLVILFRSMLNLSPEAFAGSPHLTPTPSFLPPARISASHIRRTAPGPARILWLLRAFAKTSNFNNTVLRGAWEALEDKFGAGNEEGWEHWRSSKELMEFLRACGVGVRDDRWSHRGKQGMDDQA